MKTKSDIHEQYKKTELPNGCGLKPCSTVPIGQTQKPLGEQNLTPLLLGSSELAPANSEGIQPLEERTDSAPHDSAEVSLPTRSESGQILSLTGSANAGLPTGSRENVSISLEQVEPLEEQNLVPSLLGSSELAPANNEGVKPSIKRDELMSKAVYYLTINPKKNTKDFCDEMGISVDYFTGRCKIKKVMELVREQRNIVEHETFKQLGKYLKKVGNKNAIGFKELIAVVTQMIMKNVEYLQKNPIEYRNTSEVMECQRELTKLMSVLLEKSTLHLNNETPQELFMEQVEELRAYGKYINSPPLEAT